MKTCTPIKSDRNTITITVAFAKARQVRRPGMGKHADKRLKRQSTRSARTRIAMGE